MPLVPPDHGFQHLLRIVVYKSDLDGSAGRCGRWIVAQVGLQSRDEAYQLGCLVTIRLMKILHEIVIIRRDLNAVAASVWMELPPHATCLQLHPDQDIAVLSVS